MSKIQITHDGPDGVLYTLGEYGEGSAETESSVSVEGPFERFVSVYDGEVSEQKIPDSVTVIIIPRERVYEVLVFDD